MIHDTAFIIDVMENDTAALSKLHELLRKGEPQAITAPSLFELYSGIVRSRKPEEEKRKVLRTLAGMIVFHLDADGAERAGEMDGRLTMSGLRVEPVDMLIAGIALSKGERVLTRNVKHFGRVPGLNVETY